MIKQTKMQTYDKSITTEMNKQFKLFDLDVKKKKKKQPIAQENAPQSNQTLGGINYTPNQTNATQSNLGGNTQAFNNLRLSNIEREQLALEQKKLKDNYDAVIEQDHHAKELLTEARNNNLRNFELSLSQLDKTKADDDLYLNEQHEQNKREYERNKEQINNRLQSNEKVKELKLGILDKNKTDDYFIQNRINHLLGSENEHFKAHLTADLIKRYTDVEANTIAEYENNRNNLNDIVAKLDSENEQEHIKYKKFKIDLENKYNESKNKLQNVYNETLNKIQEQDYKRTQDLKKMKNMLSDAETELLIKGKQQQKNHLIQLGTNALLNGTYKAEGYETADEYYRAIKQLAQVEDYELETLGKVRDEKKKENFIFNLANGSYKSVIDIMDNYEQLPPMIKMDTQFASNVQQEAINEFNKLLLSDDKLDTDKTFEEYASTKGLDKAKIYPKLYNNLKESYNAIVNNRRNQFIVSPNGSAYNPKAPNQELFNVSNTPLEKDTDLFKDLEKIRKDNIGTPNEWKNDNTYYFNGKPYLYKLENGNHQFYELKYDYLTNAENRNFKNFNVKDFSVENQRIKIGNGTNIYNIGTPDNLVAYTEKTDGWNRSANTYDIGGFSRGKNIHNSNRVVSWKGDNKNKNGITYNMVASEFEKSHGIKVDDKSYYKDHKDNVGKIVNFNGTYYALEFTTYDKHGYAYFVPLQRLKNNNENVWWKNKLNEWVKKEENQKSIGLYEGNLEEKAKHYTKLPSLSEIEKVGKK